jgi:hypothetical protein
LFLYFSLFSTIGKGAEELRDIVREDVGCTGVTRLALWHHDIVAEEAKRFDFTGAVKRHCKK